MKRALILCCGALAAVMGPATHADAHWWDWLQELSGPGPSRGTGPSLLATHCPVELGRPTSQPDSNDRLCLFTDFRRFSNTDEDNFPNDVTITAFDFGFSRRYSGSFRALEIGAGAGIVHFSSEDRITGSASPVTRTRFTIVPIRGVVTPGRYLPARWGTGRRIASTVKVYGRWTIIPGTITATDFGVPFGAGPGQSTFSVSHDVVASGGIVFDLGELIF